MTPTEAASWGALISATAAAIVSIIVAFRQTGTVRKVGEVHAAVQTSNGHTLGELVEGNEARHVAAGEPPTPHAVP